MATRPPIAVDEWYHCYNRGVDKRRVFQSKSDYERFLLLLYVGNSAIPIHVSNMKNRRLNEALSGTTLRGSPLVDIGAYSLMPNHFHLVVKEITEGSIALFMQKVFTGYTMYFNKKNERTGALFAGTFKSKHIADDEYLKHLISYVHLNPAGIFDPEWQHRALSDKLEKYLQNYEYSSLPEFIGKKRLQRKILSDKIFELFDKIPSMQQLLREARTYETLQYQG